jgi:hypothetical protein
MPRTNAEVVRGAEAYYRTMIQGGAWLVDLRDRHMAATLDRLMAFHGPEAKAIVWPTTHTSATPARPTWPRTGCSILGQIVREEHAADGVVLVDLGRTRDRSSPVAAGTRRWRRCRCRRLVLGAGRRRSTGSR